MLVGYKLGFVTDYSSGKWVASLAQAQSSKLVTQAVHPIRTKGKTLKNMRVTIVLCAFKSLNGSYEGQINDMFAKMRFKTHRKKQINSTRKGNCQRSVC